MTYTVDAFDISLIEKNNKDLFLQKETLEFKLNVFLSEFTIFKKRNYPELFEYEVLKKNKTVLTPNNKVLAQMKALQGDGASIEFDNIISELTDELEIVTTKIKNLYAKCNCLFSFKEMNLQNYLNQLDKYFDKKFSLEKLMIGIFNNEFYDSNIFTYIKETKDYALLQPIFTMIPFGWKDFAKVLIEEVEYYVELQEKNDVEKNEFEKNEFIRREKRKVFVKAKISKNTANNYAQSEKEEQYIKPDIKTFTTEREERQNGILKKAENSDLLKKTSGTIHKEAIRFRNLFKK